MRAAAPGKLPAITVEIPELVLSSETADIDHLAFAEHFEATVSRSAPDGAVALQRRQDSRGRTGDAGIGPCEARAEQAYLKECILRQAADIFILDDASRLGRVRQQH
ncbi:hypothetical protein [Comamonas terrae]|uniref:Uncharacterized protein n=1 Tax=Comamonas terrae TaxID=673548 RepID=A0ABW5USJ6_9BURK|nr:hypothetical protein [Comamonas terrae]